MKLIHVSIFAFALVCLVQMTPLAGRAQTPGAVYRSDTYAVSVFMEKKTVPVSLAPIVSLAIKNISDRIISRDDCSSLPRVWVQGEHGEPPTTYRERDATQRLQPGESPLPCTLNIDWSIAPGETLTKHILLKYLYDLSQPGEYSVYLEFPTGDGWLRTNTVNFSVVADKSAPDKHEPSAVSGPGQ
jgi:hypothetical protein